MKRLVTSLFGLAALALSALFVPSAFTTPAHAQCWGAGCASGGGGGSPYSTAERYSLPRETVYNVNVNSNRPTLCWRTTGNCYTFGHADTYGKGHLCNGSGNIGNVASYIRRNGGGDGSLVAWFKDDAPRGMADGRWLGSLCVADKYGNGGVCACATEIGRYPYN